MMEGLVDQTRIPLERNELTKLRVRALRRGVWFRVLTRSERALIELTTRVVDRVRGFLLAKVLSSVVKKLLDAMEGDVSRLMKTVGHLLAQRLSRIAQGWGNKSAVGWAEDSGFVQYLAVTHLNTPAMFRS